MFKSLFSNQPKYKQFSGAIAVGLITFNSTDNNEGFTRNYLYTIYRHNNGLYTFTDDKGRDTVISKGSLRFNQYYRQVMKSYDIENINIINSDNEVYFN